MPTTTLGLDVMVGETGWARHAPHPLLLVGEWRQIDANSAIMQLNCALLAD